GPLRPEIDHDDVRLVDESVRVVGDRPPVLDQGGAHGAIDPVPGGHHRTSPDAGCRRDYSPCRAGWHGTRSAAPNASSLLVAAGERRGRLRCETPGSPPKPVTPRRSAAVEFA